jgi:hypothetical protein
MRDTDRSMAKSGSLWAAIWRIDLRAIAATYGSITITVACVRPYWLVA